MATIPSEYLTKIEVALNIPSGHEDVNPELRLIHILAVIVRLSHAANYENAVMRNLLNDLQDYLEVIEIDFDKFEDDKEEYIKGWRDWQIAYAERPRRRS